MIKRISENKKQFLNLLLLADEQESMIDKYLEKGEMFTLYEAEDVVSICVVTQEDEQTLEVKNIATAPKFQKKGMAKNLSNIWKITMRGSFQY